MDHPVNRPPDVRRSPVTQGESFSEQLRGFFRRNALWFLVIALAWLLVQDIFGTHGVLAMHRSQLELQKVQQEINNLDQQNIEMQKNVKDLQNDPTTIERVGRKDLGVAKAGEFIFKTHPRSKP